MAGGPTATNRALPTDRTQALIDEVTRQGLPVDRVYLVVVSAAFEPGTVTPVGAFSSESRAKGFVDQAPLTLRACLGIQTWRINQAIENPYWTIAALGSAEGDAPLLDKAYQNFREKLLLDAENGGAEPSSGVSEP